MLRLGCASLPASLVALLLTTSARAEPIDARFDIGAHALYAVADLDGRLLDDTPAYRPSDLRLKGAGAFTGGALSGTFVYARSFRFGLTFAAFSIPSVTLTHAPLSSDLSLSLPKPYGFTVECSPGWEFHFGPFVPYAEMRLGIAFVVPSVDVRSRQMGAVATLERAVVTPIIAPRAGLQLRLNEWLAFDVSASLSPVGVETLRLQAGIVFKVNPG